MTPTIPSARPARIVARAAALGVALATALVAGSGHALPPPIAYNLSVTGPGTMTVSAFILRDTAFIWDEADAVSTFTATPDGNGAEFLGWQGDCAAAGTNDTCVIDVYCAATEISVCSVSSQQAMAAPARCRWIGATFALPGEPPPRLTNPCATGTPGEGGGSGSPGGSPATGGGSGAATPLAPGTGLPGGVVARTAPPLRRTAVTVTAAGVRTRGSAPRGTTRVVQSLALRGNAGVGIPGRCRLTRSSGQFTCTAPSRRGTWTVVTQARRGATVIAQATRSVRIP